MDVLPAPGSLLPATILGPSVVPRARDRGDPFGWALGFSLGGTGLFFPNTRRSPRRRAGRALSAPTRSVSVKRGSLPP